MVESMNAVKRGDGLLIVDVQRDFCPGGALAVSGGDEVVPVLNQWIRTATQRGIPIYASRDWHPKRHVSFKEQGGKWPAHCIQDTDGAAFHPELRMLDDTVKVTKGVRFDQDQNSVFDQTGFSEQLNRDGVRRLWIGGLAQDVCVLATVLDALESGFEVCLLSRATRPVSEAWGKEAVEKMRKAGAAVIEE